MTYCIKGRDGVHRSVADHIRNSVYDEVLSATPADIDDDGIHESSPAEPGDTGDEVSHG